MNQNHHNFDGDHRIRFAVGAGFRRESPQLIGVVIKHVNLQSCNVPIRNSQSTAP
jgi:hypothetical protein